MRFSAVALVGFAAIAYAQEVAPDATNPPGTMVDIKADPATEGGDVEADNTNPSDLFQGPFGFPVGIEKPGKGKDLPKLGPPKDINKGKDGLPVWHPPHKGIFIDDCDDDKDDKWHWAHKGKKHPKPLIPHHKWTTSTVTATKTVFDCPDKVKDCPGKPKTKYTTTTVTTTICPVPITDLPKPPPHPPKPVHPPVKPTKEGPPPSYPPKPTAPPTAPEVPEYSKPPVIVTAGAARNAVGALAVVAAFVAALI